MAFSRKATPESVMGSRDEKESTQMLPTGEQDADDRIIDAWRRRSDTDLRALGERIRKNAGYVPPESSPLIKWAPNHFRLGG